MMSSTSKRMAAAALAVTLALSLSACSNWSKRDRKTAIGAAPPSAGSLAIKWIRARFPLTLTPLHRAQPRLAADKAGAPV